MPDRHRFRAMDKWSPAGTRFPLQTFRCSVGPLLPGLRRCQASSPDCLHPLAFPATVWWWSVQHRMAVDPACDGHSKLAPLFFPIRLAVLFRQRGHSMPSLRTRTDRWSWATLISPSAMALAMLRRIAGLQSAAPNSFTELTEILSTGRRTECPQTGQHCSSVRVVSCSVGKRAQVQ